MNIETISNYDTNCSNSMQQVTSFQEKNPLIRFLAVTGVTIYLLLVFVWLRISGQVKPSIPLWRILVGYFQPAYEGELSKISPEQGHCFVASVPPHLISDECGFSKLVVMEDGRPLPQGHAPHENIRKLGGGLYSHWGDMVYFSSTDNSAPLGNGRRYTVKTVKEDRHVS